MFFFLSDWKDWLKNNIDVFLLCICIKRVKVKGQGYVVLFPAQEPVNLNLYHHFKLLYWHNLYDHFIIYNENLRENELKKKKKEYACQQVI